MTAFSLGARLSLGANSNLALSLPQSFVAAKRRQKPAHYSEGAKAAPPQSTEVISARTGEPRTRSIRLCGNTLSKCVRTAHTHKHFAAKRQNISHAQSAHFTAPKARFHTVSRHATPYFTAAHSGAMCRHSLVSSGSKREWRYRKSRQSGSENTAVHTACGAITV